MRKQTETVHGNALLPQGRWIYVSEAVLGVSECSWAHRSIQSSGRAKAPCPPSSLRHPSLCPQSLLARPVFLHRQLLCSVSTLAVLTGVSFSASSLTHTGPPTQGVFLHPDNSQCGAGSPGTWSDPAFSREGTLAVPLPVPELRAGRRVPRGAPHRAR